VVDATASHRKAPGLADRCVPLHETLEVIPQLRGRYGITRIADITRLDRIGIPSFSAIVPKSPALISVYAGKGSTREAALASSVFEAVERLAAAQPELPIRRERGRQICESFGWNRLGPRESSDQSYVDCVEGLDLISGRSILVPLTALQATTNGLASGNVPIEAIYHALCELIERHAWSLYHVRCELLPRVLGGMRAGDFGLARELAIPTQDAAVDALAAKVVDAGLRLRVMYLEEPELPPVMLASIVEEGSAPPMSHIGLGCSLSPAHAALRAIAEAAQSRLIDIQGAREDALRVDEPRIGLIPEHTRRLSAVPKNRWFYDVPAHSVALGSIPDMSTQDLAEDLHLIISSLKKSGVSTIAIVNLSPENLPVSVVRAMVPELETTTIDGRIGPKARAALNPFQTA